MAHIGRLSATFVKKHKTPGLYGDGGNLYLQITSANARSWIFRYGNRYAGLGSAANVTLAEARDLAYECRKLLQEGVDPLEARKTKKAQAKLEAAKAMTFRECALGYIEAHKAGWKNKKHLGQWRTTIAQHCGVINDLPVAAVDTDGVLAVLQPIWTTRTVTASRLRGRIEAVLDWAKVLGYRTGENPARWKGHLNKLLPKPSKVRKVVHHPALPYSRLPEFIAKLREREGVSAKALEFCILTAARTSEVLGAQPEEFDLKAGIWTVPAGRIKAEREHRVPLSAAAAQIVAAMMADSPGNALIFPGDNPGEQLDDKALSGVLSRMGVKEATVHGFRSTFRVWCAEKTSVPREVAEAAIAHKVEDETEAAYQRSDLFAKRADLMNAWARFCDGAGEAKVVPLREGKNVAR
jgi:integrase